MQTKLKIFIEYKVKREHIATYEKLMREVFPILSEFGATNIQWYVSSPTSNTYVEIFEVPTVSHFYGIKKWRNVNPLMKQLAPYIEGDSKSIKQWALVQNYNKDEWKTSVTKIRPINAT